MVVEGELKKVLVSLRAFLTKARQKRFDASIDTPHGIRKLRETLAHGPGFDPAYQLSLPPGTATVEALKAQLLSMGASKRCSVFGEHPSLDHENVDLGEALASVMGGGSGAFVSCVSGRLAYYEGEGPSDRFVLAKRGRR